MKKLIVVLGTLFATCAVQAQTAVPVPAPSPVRFVLGMGLSGGGDKLVSASYKDGSSQNVNAGGLIYFTAGADYHFTPEISVQASVNFHVDQAYAKNGDIKFQRFPIELIGYYQPHPSWRVGGGVRYVNGAKLIGSGFASGLDEKFDNTTSAVIEGEYFTSARVGIKLRYVNETFKQRGYKDIDGSHVGISANVYF